MYEPAVTTATTTDVGSLLEGALAGERPDRGGRHRPMPTGFVPLDDVLGGGLRPQELTLLGGRPGSGKTVMGLQAARWIAMHGGTAVYVCFEHRAPTLLARLFALELSTIARADEIASLDRLRHLGSDVVHGTATTEELLGDPLGEEVVGRLQAYGNRLHLVEASGRETDCDAIDALVAARRSGPTTVFVDYLQKVPFPARNDDPEARSAHVVEALKDMAMQQDVAVVAIAAADHAGFEVRRLRLQHLRGSAALAHECDAALLLNEKSVVVSKSHLAFDAVRAETFKRKTVVSVEKNRSGPSGLDIEFTKDFANFRLDPSGSFVIEKLVDDVLFTE